MRVSEGDSWEYALPTYDSHTVVGVDFAKKFDNRSAVEVVEGRYRAAIKIIDGQMERAFGIWLFGSEEAYEEARREVAKLQPLSTAEQMLQWRRDAEKVR